MIVDRQYSNHKLILSFSGRTANENALAICNKR